MSKIPDWLARLPDNAYIGTKDIADLCKCSTVTVNRRIKSGDILAPTATIWGFSKNKSFKWQVKDIRRWLRER